MAIQYAATHLLLQLLEDKMSTNIQLTTTLDGCYWTHVFCRDGGHWPIFNEERYMGTNTMFGVRRSTRERFPSRKAWDMHDYIVAENDRTTQYPFGLHAYMNFFTSNFCDEGF